MKDIECSVSAPAESRYDCTARLKDAPGCHQNLISRFVYGSGPPIVGNDYITFGNPADSRTWCGRWPPYPDKNTGPPDCPSCPGQGQGQGNPVNVATGNKFQVETDYPAMGEGSLEFVRYYNSDTTTTFLRATCCVDLCVRRHTDGYQPVAGSKVDRASP